ncbi:MAG: peptidyl-prolyl cis-trans isomerase [Gemmataceae bacterium]
MEMKNKVLAAAVLAGLGIGFCGCESVIDRPLMGPGMYDPNQPVKPPATAAPVTRSQKPEKKVSDLDFQPERTGEAADAKKVASIRVMVNTRPIFDEELRQACAPLLIGKTPAEQAEVFNLSLSNLVDQELLMQDALAKLGQSGKKYLEKVKAAATAEFDRQVKENMKKTGIKSQDEFKILLDRQGISMEGMRRQVERSFIAQEYLRSLILPSIEHQVAHPQILEYYQKHPEQFHVEDSVEWQDIFIDAGKRASRDEARYFAKQIADKLRQGQNIGELSKYDDGDSIYRKGKGYGTKHGEIQPPEAETILFNMKDGEVAPLLEMENGYHIIRLVKRTHAGQLPFDEKAQAIIRDKLRSEIFAKESKRVLADLHRKAQLEYSTAAP